MNEKILSEKDINTIKIKNDIIFFEIKTIYAKIKVRNSLQRYKVIQTSISRCVKIYITRSDT